MDNWHIALGLLSAALAIACIALGWQLAGRTVERNELGTMLVEKQNKIEALTQETIRSWHAFAFVLKEVGQISERMNKTEAKDWNAALGCKFRRQLDLVVIDVGAKYPKMFEVVSYTRVLQFFHPAAIDNTINVNQGEVYRKLAEENHPFANDIRHHAFNRHQRAVEEHAASQRKD